MTLVIMRRIATLLLIFNRVLAYYEESHRIRDHFLHSSGNISILRALEIENIKFACKTTLSE